MHELLLAALADGSGLLRCHRNSPLRGRIERAHRAGRLERVLRGIYAAAGTVTALLRCHALTLADPDIVFTGDTAAWLLRIDGAAEPRTLTAISRRLRYETPAIRTRERRLDPDLVAVVGGLRVTSPALTALDRCVRHGGEALDNALRTGIALGTLWATLARVPNRPGNSHIRRLLHDSRDEPWSEAERSAHRLLRGARITGWRSNLAVTLRTGRVMLDIAFATLRLALEIDGFTYHCSAASFESDRRRDLQLSLQGWSVHRFTAAYVFAHPEQFIADVSALLAQRAADLARTRHATAARGR